MYLILFFNLNVIVFNDLLIKMIYLQKKCLDLCCDDDSCTWAITPLFSHNNEIVSWTFHPTVACLELFQLTAPLFSLKTYHDIDLFSSLFDANEHFPMLFTSVWLISVNYTIFQDIEDLERIFVMWKGI